MGICSSSVGFFCTVQSVKEVMREEIEILTIGNVELYVEDVGETLAPAVFVIHGGPGGNCYLLREGLGEYLEDFRVIYFDQRGSGRSPELEEKPENFTIDALVGDIENLRLELGLGKISLISHGFGALQTLEYARKFPQNLSNVVVVSPWFNYPWFASQIYKMALLKKGLRKEDIEIEIPQDPNSLLDEAFADNDPKSIFDQMMFPNHQSRMEFEWMAEGDLVLGSDTPSKMFLINGLWKMNYSQFLLDVQVPVNVIMGSEDGTVYPEGEVAADLSGGSIEVVEDAGHYPWIDQPYAFEEALRLSLKND